MQQGGSEGDLTLKGFLLVGCFVVQRHNNNDKKRSKANKLELQLWVENQICEKSTPEQSTCNTLHGSEAGVTGKCCWIESHILATTPANYKAAILASRRPPTLTMTLSGCNDEISQVTQENDRNLEWQTALRWCQHLCSHVVRVGNFPFQCFSQRESSTLQEFRSQNCFFHLWPHGG